VGRAEGQRALSRIVVVGAGVGGLAVAARLGAAGHRVTVFEQAEVVGGKLGRYERDGFRFGTGPALLTLPQVFAEFFAATGTRLADELDLVPLDPVVRHVFADGTVLDSSSDPGEFTGRIDAALGPAAAADWQALWRRAARVWQASWRDILTSTVDSPGALARIAWRFGDLAAIAPGRSLRWLGRRHLRDPRLRMLLDRYATYAGADPRRAPAALVAIAYAELAFGGWHARGGLATLADALVRRCQAWGVDIRTATPVARIESAGGSVTGLRLAGGGRVPADVVVSDVDALALYRDLFPHPRRAARLADRSLSGFVLLLARPAADPVRHGEGRPDTVYFPANYDAEFDDVFGARPAADPAVFVSAASAPAGYEAWYVLVNAPPHGPVDWRRDGLADAYADRVLAVLAGRGLDVRHRITFRVIRTPADLAQATASPDGAIYGTAAHRLLRPANRGPARGLYLVGGSTHPGGGLPMVTLSAKIVADQIGRA
jgi:phytoene desaturase